MYSLGGTTLEALKVLRWIPGSGRSSGNSGRKLDMISCMLQQKLKMPGVFLVSVWFGFNFGLLS